MSVRREFRHGWVLDHEEAINETYRLHGYRSQPIFDVATPFRMDLEAAKAAEDMTTTDGRRRRGRKRKAEETAGEGAGSFLRTVHRELLADHGDLFSEPCDAATVRLNNKPVRRLVDRLEVDEPPAPSAGGGGRFEVVGGHLIPPGCEFFMDDVSRMEELLGNRTFDVIVADPPWRNKHVRRRRGYETMGRDPDDVLRLLDVGRRLERDGVLLVWCTNGRQHRRKLATWLERWGLSNVSEWFWLKVTRCGDPVVAFDKPHSKLPYERLVVASRSDGKPNSDGKNVIVSVPSAVHSHKPPLSGLLEAAMGVRPRRPLELFGRYLLPGWVTFGNEALKFQHERYFVKSSSSSS